MPRHRNAQRRAGQKTKKIEKKRTKQSAFCKLGKKSIMGLVLGSKVAESLGPGKGAWGIVLVPAACRPDFGATPPLSDGSGGHQRRLYERRLGIRLDFGRSTPPPNYPSPPLPQFSTRKYKNKLPRVPKFLPKKMQLGDPRDPRRGRKITSANHEWRAERNPTIKCTAPVRLLPPPPSSTEGAGERR